MADKIEEIVKCKRCYLYMPVSVLEKHWKDNCPVILTQDLGKKFDYLKVPSPLVPIRNR